MEGNVSIHQHDFPVHTPRLRDVAGKRPSPERVRQLVEENPGLGEMQAYRQEQQRLAIQASFRSAEGRRYWAMREARRHMGC